MASDKELKQIINSGKKCWEAIAKGIQEASVYFAKRVASDLSTADTILNSKRNAKQKMETSPEKDQEREDEVLKYTCSNCGLPGHFAAMCVTPRKR